MTEVILPVRHASSSPKDARQRESRGDATLPKFILKTLDNRRKRTQSKDKPDTYLKRYSKTLEPSVNATTSSSRFLSYRRLSNAAPFAELSKFTSEDAQCLLLHYPKSTRAKKEAIANKIEDVKKAGFAGPASVSRKNFHSSMEYKPELLADKARLLNTIVDKELQLSSGRSGIYKSMKNVSQMVKVSKKLSEEILSMDRAMRLRLHAMLHDRKEEDEGLNNDESFGNLPLDTAEMEIISRMIATTDSSENEEEDEDEDRKEETRRAAQLSSAPSTTSQHLESQEDLLVKVNAQHTTSENKQEEEEEEEEEEKNAAGRQTRSSQSRTQEEESIRSSSANTAPSSSSGGRTRRTAQTNNDPRHSSSSSRHSSRNHRHHTTGGTTSGSQGRVAPPQYVLSQTQASSSAGVLGFVASNRLKKTETKGSGFRKKRSHPQPRWIDHARLLQRAQLIADLEWNAYLSKKQEEENLNRMNNHNMMMMSGLSVQGQQTQAGASDHIEEPKRS